MTERLREVSAGMTAAVVWDEELLGYNLGDHPLDPVIHRALAVDEQYRLRGKDSSLKRFGGFLPIGICRRVMRRLPWPPTRIFHFGCGLFPTS